MHYLSTRGGMTPQSFSDILIGGLAPDGGLVIPENYSSLSNRELMQWRAYDYPQLAYAVISRFVSDIPPVDLKALIDNTYTAGVFGNDDITPVTGLDDNVYLLALSNGPTLAFKDLAMQLLGHLFSYVLERRGEQINILGATSGDTGSAAEYAMRGKPNVNVFMLSPYQKMSRFQAAQMFSLQDPNIFNIAVRGVFDDCQDLVKAVNQDAEFKARYRIGAVNSINWGRVVAQVVYYFKAYFAVTDNNSQKISMAVPSGNFGNSYAGHIARQMGLPIHRLILATNENNVLDEFFRSGIYRVRPPAEVFTTSSPSMDISKASNFERFIYDAVGRDPAVLRGLWQQLNDSGMFDLSGSDYFREIGRFGFVSGSSSHQDRLRTIREVFERYGVMIDTHTADGIKVGLEYREPGIPLVCQETALPAKFEDTIEEALGRKPPRPPGYEDIERQPQRVQIMEPDLGVLKEYIAQHTAD
jgi:threonine synthase